MSLSWGSGLQMDLKLRSVRQFLNVAPEIVHKNDRVTGSQGMSAISATSASAAASLVR